MYSSYSHAQVALFFLHLHKSYSNRRCSLQTNVRFRLKRSKFIIRKENNFNLREKEKLKETLIHNKLYLI